MEEKRISFPLVWNCLIADKTNFERGEGGQVAAIETVFGYKLEPLKNSNDRSKVSTWISGKKVFSKEYTQALLDLEQAEKVDVIAQRIGLLTIYSIRNVVSAFHQYIDDHGIIIGSADKLAMQHALEVDSPELYIASALLAGLRFREKQQKLTKAEMKNLRSIANTTKYPDAFEKAQKVTTKEEEEENQINNESLAQKASELEPQIKSRYLKKVLRDLNHYLDEIKEPLPPDVKEILTGLSETELHMFLDTKDRILCRSMGMFREYFYLAQENDFSEFKYPGLFISSYYIETLQEMGMLEDSPEHIAVFAHDLGVEPFEDSNRDYALKITAKTRAKSMGIRIPVYRFTIAGIIVANFMGLLTNETYLYAMAEMFKTLFGEDFEVEIIERKLDYLSFVERMKEDEKRRENLDNSLNEELSEIPQKENAQT